MEGKEWVWDNGIIKEQDVSEIKAQIERETRERKVLLTDQCFR